MMTMIIAMIIKLLSGMKAIKNARPRKQKLRKNFCPLPGIPFVRRIGVCQKARRGGGSNR